MSYVTIQNFLSASGVFWSTFLIYLALTKSPSVMRPCVIIIVIKSTTDLMASILNFLLKERIISNGAIIFVISEGPCSLESNQFCFSSHVIFLSLLQQNLVWMICSYVFRYYILKYKDPSLIAFLFTAIVTYFPLFINSSFWINTFNIWAANSDQHGPRLFSKPDDLVMAGWVVDQFNMMSLAFLMVTSVVTFCGSLWIRHFLVRFLKEKTARLSKTTILLNMQLVKALHLQSAIPILTFLAVLNLIFMHYSLIEPIRLQAISSTFFAATLSIFPISYILFLPPFFKFCIANPGRMAVRKIKGKMSSEVTAVTSYSIHN